MNFIRELIEGSHRFTHETGGYPTRIFVPRWRCHELEQSFHEMFPFSRPNDTPNPQCCDFTVAGMCGRWWDRDYIEYQL